MAGDAGGTGTRGSRRHRRARVDVGIGPPDHRRPPRRADDPQPAGAPRSAGVVMTPPTAPAGYEPRDLSPRRISALVLALFGGIAISCSAVAILFALFPHLPTAGPWW